MCQWVVYTVLLMSQKIPLMQLGLPLNIWLVHVHVQFTTFFNIHQHIHVVYLYFLLTGTLVERSTSRIPITPPTPTPHPIFHASHTFPLTPLMPAVSEHVRPSRLSV